MYWEVCFYLVSGLIFMLIFMGLLYGVYRLLNEPSAVDIGWAGGLGILALYYFIYSEMYGPRQIIVFCFAIVWSLRLVAHLFDRFRKGVEDKRYQHLNEKWSDNLAINYFFYFMFQGAAAAALSSVFAIAILNKTSYNVWDSVGIAFFAVGFFGEVWADWTLRQFREDPSNEKEVCQRGLWRFSRHPNFFFEIVVWIGFAFFAFSAPYGFVGFFAPLLIAFFLVLLTGIPLTERELLEAKGEKYEEYIRTTSMLIPWFHK